MVYNDILKKEIPEGWEVAVFNDWVKTIYRLGNGVKRI